MMEREMDMLEPVTMFEQVARAVATMSWRLEIDEFKEPERWAQAVDAYDLTNNSGRFGYDQIAKAAIEVIASASEAFGTFCYDRQEDGVASWAIGDWTDGCFNAFFDAALKEHEGEK
jgi:hypothetical protein